MSNLDAQLEGDETLPDLADVYLLNGSPSQALRQVVRRVRRQFVDVNRRIARAAVLFQECDARIDELRAVAVGVVVVDTVADLPANASPREWFRVRTGTQAERFAVYIGNGPAAPLTKITPTAL